MPVLNEDQLSRWRRRLAVIDHDEALAVRHHVIYSADGRLLEFETSGIFPTIGESLLHYRVTEEIGAGGMGVIYRDTESSSDEEG